MKRDKEKKVKKVKKVKTDKPEKINPIPEGYDPKSTGTFLFTFSNFKMKAVDIKDEFNNHYKTLNDFARIITVFLAKGLPLWSNERDEMNKNYQKCKVLHFHQIKGKDEILRKILKEYNFSERLINELLEGESLYQLEIPYLNGAPRVVFQKIENIISVLFIDANHHIYVNTQKQRVSHSFDYTYCPVKELVKQ